MEILDQARQSIEANKSENPTSNLATTFRFVYIAQNIF